MPELDARRLRVLHAVAVRGSVTAAAEALQVSASAISQQLAQLEREAKCDLIERAGRGIALTPAGVALAAQAEHVLRELDRAQAVVAAARGAVSGVVRVGSMPSVAGAHVGPATARAHASHPGLDVRICEREDGQALIDLRLANLDVVILQEYDHVPITLPPGLDVTPMLIDPMHLITPAIGPLRDLGPAPLSALRDAPWIAAAHDTPCGRSTRQACRDAGFEPDIRHTAIDFAMIVDLVAAGLGIALIPLLGLRYRPDNICVHRMDPASMRTIFAVSRSAGVGPQRPAIAALLAELRSEAPIRVRAAAPSS
jgi:DNA-binding transcriptional LysR family regulator